MHGIHRDNCIHQQLRWGGTWQQVFCFLWESLNFTQQSRANENDSGLSFIAGRVRSQIACLYSFPLTLGTFFFFFFCWLLACWAQTENQTHLRGFTRKSVNVKCKSKSKHSKEANDNKNSKSKSCKSDKETDVRKIDRQNIKCK